MSGEARFKPRGPGLLSTHCGHLTSQRTSLMQYVLTITEAAFSQAVCAEIERRFGVRVESLGPSLNDWNDEPAKFERASSFGDHEVSAVNYREAGVERLRAALLHIASLGPCLIDDDFDLFVDGRRFAELCEQNPHNDDWWLPTR